MTLKEAFQINLPKWPCCLMYGKSVTESQALEIIRRTDDFFEYQIGNNRAFIESAIETLHIPQFVAGSDWDKYCDEELKWKQRWGFIPLEYLYNDWISSSWIGGPHGWCQPSGKIAARHNIGKWPTVEAIYTELCTIAKAFPFLSMTCAVLTGEDETPDLDIAVAFRVSNGEVSLLEGLSIDEALTACSEKGISERFNPYLLLNNNRENAIPMSQLRKWYNQIFDD